MGLLLESEKANLLKMLVDSKKAHGVLVREIEILKHKSVRLDQQLSTNGVTGLPNALVLHRDLEALLKQNSHEKAILFVALNDNYAMLKKTFASKIPEWVLYQTSLRLTKLLGTADTVYHTKEDEFLIVMNSIVSRDDVFSLAKHIIEKLEKSHGVGGYNISLGVNIGIGFYPENGTTKSEILRNTDIALSEATKKKIPFQYFTPELKSVMLERIELTNGILQALEAQANVSQAPQFFLAFQPQIRVIPQHVGSPRLQILGAEALIRWRHPTLGVIPPSRFIGIAEETGLIVPLGNWILHSTINALLELKKNNLSELLISMNLSPRQFEYQDISKTIPEIVAKRGISPHSLKLEITESGLMQNYQQAIQKIQKLRDAGFKIMVDDFGTGHSSLSQIKHLPVDYLKVDKSFVDGIPDDMSDQALLKAILTLSRDMKLKNVVEGTENLAQVQWLLRNGFDAFQGYFFSRPLELQNFIAFAHGLKNKTLDDFAKPPR